MSDRLPPVALIGAGNMGSAIVAGLRRLDEPPAVSVFDPDEATQQRHRRAGLRVAATSREAVQEAGIVVLAVKPQVAEEALAELAPHLDDRHLLVSILAGTTIARLESGLGPDVRVVRAMPNTPMAIGRGMVALAAGSRSGDRELRLAEALFAPAGRVLRVDEGLMDAVTAVSGSGPAYLFRFAEALHAAARGVGFDDGQAALLVGTTLHGAIEYLLSEEGFPAARLRRQVTSPGGTTAAAMAALDDGGFDELVARAVTAARDRSRELAG